MGAVRSLGMCLAASQARIDTILPAKIKPEFDIMFLIPLLRLSLSPASLIVSAMISWRPHCDTLSLVELFC